MLHNYSILLRITLICFLIPKIESKAEVELDPGVSQLICSQTTRFYWTDQIQIASFDQFAHKLVIDENCKVILWDYFCDKAKKSCDKFVCKPHQKQKRNINHGPGRNKNYIFVRARPNNGANPIAERSIKTIRAVNNVHVSKGGRSPNTNHGLKSGRAPLSSRTMAKPYTFCNSTLNDTNNSETLIQGYTTPRYYPYTHDPYSNQTDPFEMFLNKTENFTEFANDTGYFPEDVNGTSYLPAEVTEDPYTNITSKDPNNAYNLSSYYAVGQKANEVECSEHSECESKQCCQNPGFGFWDKACFSNCSTDDNEYELNYELTINKKTFYHFQRPKLTWVQAVIKCISKNSALADIDKADQSELSNALGEFWAAEYGSNKGVWLGGHIIDGEYKWLRNDKKIDHDLFAINTYPLTLQSQRSCVIFAHWLDDRKDKNKLTTISCKAKRQFLCVKNK